MRIIWNKNNYNPKIRQKLKKRLQEGKLKIKQSRIKQYMNRPMSRMDDRRRIAFKKNLDDSDHKNKTIDMGIDKIR